MAEDIRFTDLNSIRIAAPCHASWHKMTRIDGDRVRHCGECDLNVYDLSAMSRREAMKLVEQHQGQLCVRFYRRKDGTILTQDCPVGVKKSLSGMLSTALLRLTEAILSLPPLKQFILGMGPGMGRTYVPPDDCPQDLRDIWMEGQEAELQKEREREKVIRKRVEEEFRKSL